MRERDLDEQERAREDLERREDDARELDERAERIAEHASLPYGPDARCYALARLQLGYPCS